jgi:hypothetical protein
VDRAQKVSENRSIPDEAFMFGGAAFLQQAASELDAIVRGGGRMKTRPPKPAKKPAAKTAKKPAKKSAKASKPSKTK